MTDRVCPYPWPDQVKDGSDDSDEKYELIDWHIPADIPDDIIRLCLQPVPLCLLQCEEGEDQGEQWQEQDTVELRAQRQAERHGGREEVATAVPLQRDHEEVNSQREEQYQRRLQRCDLRMGHEDRDERKDQRRGDADFTTEEVAPEQVYDHAGEGSP